MDEYAERIQIWLTAHALPAVDEHGHPLAVLDINFKQGDYNSFDPLRAMGGSEDPVGSPPRPRRRRRRRHRRRHPVENAPQAEAPAPEREQLPPAAPIRRARSWSFSRRFLVIAAVAVLVILLHFVTPAMGHGTIREFDFSQLQQGTTSGNLKLKARDHFDWRERDPLRVSLLAIRQDDFPAPQDFCTDRDGPTTPRADSFEAPGGALASSIPASRSGAASKFRRDERVTAQAPPPATWMILACVPSVALAPSDDDFKARDHLAFDWRDPPGVSLLTLRQSASVYPAPQDFCPDRDDHPHVVAIDSAGGLLLRGARGNAQYFGPGVALGFYPAPSCANDGGDILCDASLRTALLFPPYSDDYRLLCAGNVGIIQFHKTAADGEHQIRLVAELQPEAGNGIHRATLLRCPQELRVSASKEAKSPTSRRP